MGFVFSHCISWSVEATSLHSSLEACRSLMTLPVILGSALGLNCSLHARCSLKSTNGDVVLPEEKVKVIHYYYHNYLKLILTSKALCSQSWLVWLFVHQCLAHWTCRVPTRWPAADSADLLHWLFAFKIRVRCTTSLSRSFSDSILVSCIMCSYYSLFECTTTSTSFTVSTLLLLLLLLSFIN